MTSLSLLYSALYLPHSSPALCLTPLTCWLSMLAQDHLNGSIWLWLPCYSKRMPSPSPPHPRANPVFYGYLSDIIYLLNAMEYSPHRWHSVYHSLIYKCGKWSPKRLLSAQVSMTEENSKDVNPVSLSSRLLTRQRHTFNLNYWVLLPWPLRALTTLVECRSPNCPWIPLARAKVGEEETEIRTEKGARMRKTLSTRRNCKSQWWKLKCTERIRTR